VSHTDRPPRRRTPSTTPILIVCLFVLVTGVGVGGYLVLNGTQQRDHLVAVPKPDASVPSADGREPSPVAPTPTPTPAAPRSYAATGPGTYVYASGQSAVFGTAGGLQKYRVAIETGTPVPVDEFAGMVDATLSDPRSWIAGNNVRLQRVGGDVGGYNFTVYLVTPGTAEKLCQAGGFDIFWRGEPYTSCRVGGKVVINITRYLKGIPNYGAPLEVYQQYAINHEVGHALGHGHELCPAKGKPAPVMQQQTFDLQGCVAFAWPFLDGKRYAGPEGRIVPSN
jgi:hypothetical protein